MLGHHWDPSGPLRAIVSLGTDGAGPGKEEETCCPIRVNILCLCSSGERAKLGTFQIGAVLMAQQVKNLPAVQMQVQSLGKEDPLEKEMTTHSSILAWRIPWTEEPSGL